MIDFRNTKIRILSAEHSRVFQEAVFEAGGTWNDSNVIQNLGRPFVFVDSQLRMNVLYQTINYFDQHPATEIEFPPKGHVHAALMLQYAHDAKTHVEPWRLWEIKADDGIWWDCQYSPMWEDITEYRRKIKTHIIHGVEIPDLRVSLKSGDNFYLANPTSPELTTLYWFDGDIKDEIWVERGLTYQPTEEGKQAAIIHAKAMLGM